MAVAAAAATGGDGDGNADLILNLSFLLYVQCHTLQYTPRAVIPI